MWQSAKSAFTRANYATEQMGPLAQISNTLMSLGTELRSRAAHYRMLAESSLDPRVAVAANICAQELEAEAQHIQKAYWLAPASPMHD